jgi:phosphoribosylformylglycinamidine cyclo-ligase
MTKYSDAGVDIMRGDIAKKRIIDSISSTYGPRVISRGGEFGGIYRIPNSNILSISSIDGVGTKIKVAILAKRHDTIGQDLVNHSVNDIAVMGAIPAFFMDYYSAGVIDETILHEIIDGLVQACKVHSIALIAGETAQMPGIYHGNDYDLAGAIVGFVEENNLLPNTQIIEGDTLIGIPSNGLHTNGYSLARKIIFDIRRWNIESYNDALQCTWAEELLRVHRSYYPEIQLLTTDKLVKGLAHITGGGIPGNLSRIIPHKCVAIIEKNKIPVTPVFRIIQDVGSVSDAEMYDVFNMGIGMICVVEGSKADKVINSIPGRYVSAV